MPTHSIVRVLPEVRHALDRGEPVVALESSVLAQGLPVPHNRTACERMVHAVRAVGAVPAITAVAAGVPCVGLESEELDRFLERDGARKVSARDLPAAMTQRADGATTVAASLALASVAGITVFATGGIGGVHRDAPYDESADLAELARTRMIVVCAGAKSILDLPATWERLESLGIPVVGFNTRELPGFFTAETGIGLDASTSDVAEIAAMYAAHCALGRPQSLLVVQPPPAAYAMPRESVEQAVEQAQRDAREKGIRGAAVTPHLLASVSRLTAGSSLATNLALLEDNAALAAKIASVCSTNA